MSLTITPHTQTPSSVDSAVNTTAKTSENPQKVASAPTSPASDTVKLTGAEGPADKEVTQSSDAQAAAFAQRLSDVEADDLMRETIKAILHQGKPAVTAQANQSVQKTAQLLNND